MWPDETWELRSYHSCYHRWINPNSNKSLSNLKKIFFAKAKDNINMWNFSWNEEEILEFSSNTSNTHFHYIFIKFNSILYELT